MKREADLLEELRAMAKATSQKELAHKLNISPQYMNDIMLGRRGISEIVALNIGYRRVVLFEPLDRGCPECSRREG